MCEIKPRNFLRNMDRKAFPVFFHQQMLFHQLFQKQTSIQMPILQDKPFRLIIRLLSGFSSDSIKLNVAKYPPIVRGFLASAATCRLLWICHLLCHLLYTDAFFGRILYNALHTKYDFKTRLALHLWKGKLLLKPTVSVYSHHCTNAFFAWVAICNVTQSWASKIQNEQQKSLTHKRKSCYFLLLWIWKRIQPLSCHLSWLQQHLTIAQH